MIRFLIAIGFNVVEAVAFRFFGASLSLGWKRVAGCAVQS